MKTVSLFCLFSRKVSRKDKYTGYFYLLYILHSFESDIDPYKKINMFVQAGCGFLKILNTHLLIKDIEQYQTVISEFG